MLNKKKLYFISGIIGLAGVIASYGIGARLDEALEEDPFMRAYSQTMMCCLKTMIEHHREYGVSEKNRRKIRAIIDPRGKFKQDLEALEDLYVNGIMHIWEGVQEEGNDETMMIEKILLPIEENKHFAARFEKCNERPIKECSTYETALNTFIKTAKKMQQQQPNLRLPKDGF